MNGMQKEQLFQKLSELIRKIADNEGLELSETTAFDTIENWDSLNTVDLEMEAESAFGISFETGEFQEYKNIEQLMDAILSKLS